MLLLVSFDCRLPIGPIIYGFPALSLSLSLTAVVFFFCWPHLTTAPSALWRDCNAGQRIRFRSLLSHHVGCRTQSHSGWHTHRHRAARETWVRTGATGAAAAERDTGLHSRWGECVKQSNVAGAKAAFPPYRSSVVLCWKWPMPVSVPADRRLRRPRVSMSCTCSATQMSPYFLQTLSTLRHSRPRWRPAIWSKRLTISLVDSIKSHR